MSEQQVAEPVQRTRSFRLSRGNKWEVIAFGVFLCIFVAGAAYFFAMNMKGEARYSAYANCAMGSDFSAFIPKADGSVQVENVRVYYFWGFKSSSKRAVLPAKVDHCQDLPWAYDAMQFMVNEHGVLIAKGWCGETTQLETVDGPFPGRSGLDELFEIPGRQKPNAR